MFCFTIIATMLLSSTMSFGLKRMLHSGENVELASDEALDDFYMKLTCAKLDMILLHFSGPLKEYRHL